MQHLSYPNEPREYGAGRNAGDLADPLCGLLEMRHESRGNFFPSVSYDDTNGGMRT